MDGLTNHGGMAMGLPLESEKKYTYADYYSWDDTQRWELIEGEVYNMTPAPSPFHQHIVLRLGRFLDDYLEGKLCKAFVSPFDVRLPKGDEHDDDVTTVVQPDLVVVCDRTKIDDRGCRGAPDLIMEILSPSTAARDNIEKLALYEKHGVREYWLVHPSDRLTTVYLLGSDGHYGRPAIYSAEDVVPVTILPEFSIDLKRVFTEE